MYNVRYHIASLVAVFLALALGLILGGVVVQRGTVDRQQGTLVDGLRREFATLRNENRELTAQNQILTGFSADASTWWVQDRLVGKNVVVVSGAGRVDGVDAAIDAIESAGGTVIWVTLVKPDLGLQEAEVRSGVSSETYSVELLASVAASLAAEWTMPSTEHPVSEALQSAKAITIDGLEPGMAAAALVNVAIGAGEPEAAGLELARAFKTLDAVAVGGESDTVKSGLAETSWSREVPAFDSLGTDVGRYTLVALLTGAKPGLYGTAESASAPYPEIPEK